MAHVEPIVEITDPMFRIMESVQKRTPGTTIQWSDQALKGLKKSTEDKRSLKERLLRKLKDPIVNVDLVLRNTHTPGDDMQFHFEAHTVTYGKFIVWYAKTNKPYDGGWSIHPFKRLHDIDDISDGTEKGDHVYDNAVTRTLIAHIAMSDDELATHTNELNNLMEYRASLLQALNSLWD